MEPIREIETITLQARWYEVFTLLTQNYGGKRRDNKLTIPLRRRELTFLDLDSQWPEPSAYSELVVTPTVLGKKIQLELQLLMFPDSRGNYFDDRPTFWEIINLLTTSFPIIGED